MKIGVIGPTEGEIMPFINNITGSTKSEHAKLKFYTGTYEGIDVVSVFCGVCKVNAAIATQILISEFKVTHVLLVGVAGALNSRLQIGDTIISSEIAYHDVAKSILTEYHPWMEDIFFRPDIQLFSLCREVADSLSVSNKFHDGRIITGEAFITHREREILIEKFHPLCVDMESGSVAHTCYVNNIPFLVIRSISDNADENGSESFENNMEAAALNSINLAKELIKRLAS